MEIKEVSKQTQIKSKIYSLLQNFQNCPVDQFGVFGGPILGPRPYV